MIEFDHVTYAYGNGTGPPVVDDLCLRIDSGEEAVIMGGNGCGKTTLGLLLCGILKPDRGRVLIDGIPAGEAGTPIPIGFLFQDPDNGLVATTVEREVAFTLENRNMATAEMQDIVDATLDRFDLEKSRARLVWTLSGGEKQRLSLAGIFAAGPGILFLDEPASYLDYAGSRQLDVCLAQVRRANPALTVLRVTQYADVALDYPRMIIMGDGKVLRDGKPRDVFSDRELMRQTGLRPPLEFLTPMASPGGVAGRGFAAERPTFLEVREVVFAYEPSNGEPLFSGLSLSIGRGEILGLAGPSGCGKSTLAQMICGIYEPDEGSIEFCDDDGKAVMSFQQPERQFFLDTTYQEVRYGIKDRYESDALIDTKVRDSMEAAGLEYDLFKDRDPHTLSGGEARRLAFAVVIALEADLLIFDEPTCGLDEAGIQAFGRMVRNLQGQGKTVILISHNSDIIGDLADRVALMGGGKIESASDAFTFFTSGGYEEILPVPHIIGYQKGAFGDVRTVRTRDIFEASQF